MKFWNKRKIRIGTIALVMVASLCGYRYFSVRAELLESKNYVFPGIASQIAALSNMPSTGDDAYDILEITPDGEAGRMGYLVEGQEPVMLQDRLNEYFVQSGLENTSASRINYMNHTLPTLLGESGLNLVEGDTVSEPLTYNGEYKEYPFSVLVPSGKESGEIQLSHSEMVNIKGTYEENEQGVGNYDENVVGFSLDDANGNYEVLFNEIQWTNPRSEESDNEIYNHIYKSNVGSLGAKYYTDLGDDATATTYMANLLSVQSNTQGTFLATFEEKSISVYPDGTNVAKTLKNQPYKKVVQDGSVNYELVTKAEFSASTNYWFVNKVEHYETLTAVNANQTICVVSFKEKYYQVTSYKYYGISNFSNYIGNVDAEKPYRLVDGDGYYDFIPSVDGSTGVAQDVEYNTVYYTGGYQNNNWFKHKILVTDLADQVAINVHSYTETELFSMSVEERAELVSSCDYIRLLGSSDGTNLYDTISSDLASASVKEGFVQLLADKVAQGTPLQMDQSIYNNSKSSKVSTSLGDFSYFYRLAVFAAISDRTDTEYVDVDVSTVPSNSQWQTFKSLVGTSDVGMINRNVYVGGNNKGAFYPEMEALVSNNDYEEVMNYIELENLSRGESELLCVNGAKEITLYKKQMVQYIINYKSKTEVTIKSKIKILDLEPANGNDYKPCYTRAEDDKVDDSVLTEYKVQQKLLKASNGDMNISSEDIEIVHMTTSEFIGHNDDLNATYDVIYIGVGYNGDVMNRVNGKTVYNDSLLNGLVYRHTGDQVFTNNDLNGQLDTDYMSANYTEAYGTNFYNYAYVWNSYTNRISTDWIQKDMNYYERAHSWSAWEAKMDSYNIGNIGFFRYSDNDITKLKMKDLYEYVAGNYPVIVSDDCLTKVAGGEYSVNEQVVDNSSYLEQFLSDEMGKSNVMNLSDANASAQLINYINITKPVIEFLDSRGEVIQDNSDTTNSDGMAYPGNYEYGENIATLVDGQFRTNFQINNGEENQIKQSQYILKFYVDMNADGKYVDTVDKSELLQDVELQTVDGTKVSRNVNGDYIVWSNKEYILVRSMGEAFTGILPWKLEVIQLTNDNARISQIAYTEAQVDAGADKVIRVLQVLPSSKSVTVNLKSTTMQKYMNQVDGYDIQVDQCYSNNISANYLDYDMMVVGFADSYLNANSEDSKAKIKAFAATGKSMLMTHDFVSYKNIDTDITRVINYNASGKTSESYTVNTADKGVADDFRDLLGLDRYGVTTKEVADGATVSQSDFLRQGELLNYSATDDTWSTEYQSSTKTTDSQHDEPTMVGKTTVLAQPLLTDRDIAYVPNTNGQQAYAEVQGYNDGQLNRSYSGSKNTYRNNNVTGTNMLTNQADQINDGVITHYPFEIGSDIRTASTHCQYYELDMDSDKDKDGDPDIVVWYTISPGTQSNSIASGTKGDCRNNFYIYSIGNIMYTGVGHSSLNENDDAQEIKLFVNTFIAAYKLQPESFEIKSLETASRNSSEEDSFLMTTDGLTRLDNSVQFHISVQDPNLISSRKVVTTSYSLMDTSYTGTSTTDDPRSNHIINIPAGVTFTTVDSETGKIVGTGSSITGMQSGRIYTVTVDGISGVSDLDFIVETNISSTYNYYGIDVTKIGNSNILFQSATLFDLN